MSLYLFSIHCIYGNTEVTSVQKTKYEQCIRPLIEAQDNNDY